MIAQKAAINFQRVRTGVAFAFAVLGLQACAPPAGISQADRAELNNMWRANLVPKSRPKQLVAAFDQFCTQGPRDEATLRAAGYVPLPERTEGARAYVIDNRKPAVAVSETMCLVQAESRTGQTTRFQTYVAETYPSAKVIDPARLGEDIEQAWSVPTDPPSVIATERTVSLSWYRYALILFQPEAT